MKHPRFSFCILHFAFCIFLFASGCGTSGPSIVVIPTTTNTRLIANFNRAYWAEDQAGEDRIVLLNDPVELQPADGPGQPLQPLTSPPLRQLLVIDLQWRSAIAVNLDTPASQNAVLNWYVYGGQGLIQYHGTGFVTVSPDGNAADVSIKNSSLALAQSTGGLIDPLGSFTTNGSFHAVDDPVHIHQVLADLATAQADMQPRKRTTEPATEPATHPSTTSTTSP